jgi:hypothetical protein
MLNRELSALSAGEILLVGEFRYDVYIAFARPVPVGRMSLRGRAW